MTPTLTNRLEEALENQKSANIEVEILRICGQNDCEIFGSDEEAKMLSTPESKFVGYYAVDYAVGGNAPNLEFKFGVFGDSKNRIESIAAFYSILRWGSPCTLISMDDCAVLK